MHVDLHPDHESQAAAAAGIYRHEPGGWLSLSWGKDRFTIHRQTPESLADLIDRITAAAAEMKELLEPADDGPDPFEDTAERLRREAA